MPRFPDTLKFYPTEYFHQNILLNILNRLLNLVTLNNPIMPELLFIEIQVKMWQHGLWANVNLDLFGRSC